MRARIKLSAAEKGVYYVQADYDRKIVELLRQLTPESKEKLITWILEISGDILKAKSIMRASNGSRDSPSFAGVSFFRLLIIPPEAPEWLRLRITQVLVALLHWKIIQRMVSLVCGWVIMRASFIKRKKIL